MESNMAAPVLLILLLSPWLGLALPLHTEQKGQQKFFLDNVKSDLSSYVQNINLVGTDNNGLLLALPDKSGIPASWNISVVSNEQFNRATVANLMLIGAAGYLLSFLPTEVFRSLITPLENAQSSLISRNEEGDEAEIPNFDNFDYDNFVDPFDEYLQPSESFVQPFSLPFSDKKVRRRGDPKKKEIGFLENLGRQVQSWFGGRGGRPGQPPHQPQRRQRGGGGLEAREERFEQFQENLQHQSDTEAHLEEEQEEEEEDIGFFKKVEKAIASLFLDSPIARVSEESGLGNLVNNVANFWTENFSWEEGKYSPRNILAPKEEEEVEADARDERKLYDEAETDMDDVEEIISEIYDDDWQTMQAESSYKSEVVAEKALMTDSLEPPPAPAPVLL